MPWLRDRLTRRRLGLIALVLVVAVALLAIGDPLSHPGEGEQASGERGIAGMPRIVEIAAIVVAFILAMPPRRGTDEADEDDDGEG